VPDQEQVSENNLESDSSDFELLYFHLNYLTDTSKNLNGALCYEF
jgi:hypothetical protein